MKSISFFDLEMDFDSHEIVDIGRVKSVGEIFHSTFMQNVTSLQIIASRIYQINFVYLAILCMLA